MRTSLPIASLVLLVLALVAPPALAAQPDQPLRAALLGSPTASAVGPADGDATFAVNGCYRLATSVAVAEAIESVPAEIVLAFGGDYPEALFAGAVAPPLGGVALLVDRAGVPAEVRAFLDAHPDTPVFTVGTVATDVVEGEARFATAPTPSLLSAALLQMYPTGGEVGVASVEAFPDGLTGGACAASRAIPLLLSPRDSLTQGLIDGMARYGPYERITFFGGDAALSATTAGQAASHLQ